MKGRAPQSAKSGASRSRLISIEELKKQKDVSVITLDNYQRIQTEINIKPNSELDCEKQIQLEQKRQKLASAKVILLLR